MYYSQLIPVLILLLISSFDAQVDEISTSKPPATQNHRHNKVNEIAGHKGRRDSDGFATGLWIKSFGDGTVKSQVLLNCGEILCVTEFNEVGNLKHFQPFAEGVPHGRAVWVRADGILLGQANFVSGTGTEPVFSDDGKLIRFREWVDGQLMNSREPSN